MLEISTFSSGEKFLATFSLAKYEIIFMDVQMGNFDGIDTAKKIREIDNSTIIMFFTDFSQYAIKGYQVDALDFVVNPNNNSFLLRKCAFKRIWCGHFWLPNKRSD